MSKIIKAETAPQIEEIRKLFREYEDFLGIDLCFQGFEKELSNLPGVYAAPHGCLLLAEYESQAAGCAALKRISSDTCEMKRLFVRPGFHGKAIGRKLAEELIMEARQIGYKRMRLDSLRHLKDAIALYRSLGFKEIDPYIYNPLEDVIFMELELHSNN